MKKIYLALITSMVYSLSYSQSNGTLDPYFGTGGLVTVDYNNNNDDGNDLLLMPDKSIIVGGTSFITGNDFSFCSFTAAGLLNTLFGNGGKVVLDIENDSKDFLTAIVLDLNQKIVGAGYTYTGTDQYITIVRLNANGTLDSAFGTNGIVKLKPAPESVAFDVAIQPDNKIVIGGYVADGLTSQKAVIIRLNEDGSYDGPFGDNGVWEGSPDPAYDVQGYAIALQDDGKILIAGYHDVNGDSRFAVGRIVPGGSMDVTFDTDGWVVKNLTTTTDDIAHSVAVQNDGKILLAGESNGEVAICRLNNDGSDDIAFADNGVFINPLLANDDALYDVILQPDDMIVAAGGGSIDDNVDFLLLRLTSNGALDAGFDNDGVVYTNFNGSNDFAYSVVLQPDNKIVAAGSAFNYYWTDFAVARYGNGFTEVSDYGDYLRMEVYPNPSNGNVEIKTVGTAPRVKIGYKVSDITGRMVTGGVLPVGEERLMLDMNEQPAGIYFAELKDGSKQEVIARNKFVIQ